VLVVDAIYQALLDAGVPDGEVTRVERLVSTFVLGYAISEVGGRFARLDWRERRGRLEGVELPAHRRLAGLAETAWSRDMEFETDLDDLVKLVENVAGRVTRFQAPEYLVPQGQWPDEQLWKEFEAARLRTGEFARSTEADLRKHFYAHPVLGELDLYQWLLLISAHCDRHRAQSEEVMASAGFPRSSAAAS